MSVHPDIAYSVSFRSGTVFVNQYTAILFLSFSGLYLWWPLKRLVILNRAIHTGDIYGVPSKIVMSIASLALALQAVSGVVMWWKRR